MPSEIRNLVLVLGDQLNDDSAAFNGFDRTRDQVWMAEVSEESTHVWTHKARIVMFLSAMRKSRGVDPGAQVMALYDRILLGLRGAKPSADAA